MLFLTSPHPLTPCLAGRQASPEVGRGRGTPLPACTVVPAGRQTSPLKVGGQEGGEMTF